MRRKIKVYFGVLTIEEKELEGSEEMLDEKPGRSDGQSDKDELSVVQPLEEPVKKKKWWQFWK